MARGDICENRGRGRTVTPFLLDLQADMLARLETRVVAPVLAGRSVPPDLARLHLRVTIDGEDHLVAIHLLAAVPRRDLGTVRATLDDRQHEAMNALDVLFAGI